MLKLRQNVCMDLKTGVLSHTNRVLRGYENGCFSKCKTCACVDVKTGVLANAKRVCVDVKTGVLANAKRVCVDVITGVFSRRNNRTAGRTQYAAHATSGPLFKHRQDAPNTLLSNVVSDIACFLGR